MMHVFVCIYIYSCVVHDIRKVLKDACYTVELGVNMLQVYASVPHTYITMLRIYHQRMCTVYV